MPTRTFFSLRRSTWPETLYHPFRHLFIAEVSLPLERLADLPETILARPFRVPFVHLVGLGLIIKGHQIVSVKNRKCQLQKQGKVYFDAVPLFQAGKIQGHDGDLGELRFQRLAYEGNIVGRAAAAARLRDHHRRPVHVVFPAFERVDILPDDAERGIAGIVVHVFEALVDNGAGIVFQNLHLIASALPPRGG